MKHDEFKKCRDNGDDEDDDGGMRLLSDFALVATMPTIFS